MSNRKRKDNLLIYDFFKQISQKNTAHIPKVLYVVRNMIFTPEGSLKAFPKFKKLVHLNKPHSLYRISPDEYFIVAEENGQDKLYRFLLNSNTLQLLKTLGEHVPKTYFAQHGTKFFISSKNYKTIYDRKTNLFLNWEPQTKFSFDDNLEVASDYAFTDIIDVPNLERLKIWRGRIFGTQDNKLWFSEAYFPTFFRATNYFEFDENIIGFDVGISRAIVLTRNAYYVCLPFQTESFQFPSPILSIEKVDLPDIIPDSIVAYQDNFVFLCREGIVFIKSGSNQHILLNKTSIDFIIEGISQVYKLREGEYLLGGGGATIQFYDEVTAEIFRKT